MPETIGPSAKDVFISYSSRDHDQVVRIAAALERAGVSVWRDGDEILGGRDYGPEIVHAIERCKVMMLMCSDASMNSRNVHQEIKLAWCYERPYLPLLLDDSIESTYPKQVQYWLEGNQWITVLDQPAEAWMPAIARAVSSLGIVCDGVAEAVVADAPIVESTRPANGLAGIRAAACYTTDIWPESVDTLQRGRVPGRRGLGAAPTHAQHEYQLGDHLRLSIKSRRQGHLLLLDEGPEGTVYCLCPSLFAPDSRIEIGQTVLPQEDSPYNSFEVSGMPGQERLLAIITDEPLGLDWASVEADTPARIVSEADVDDLLRRLRALGDARWTALSTSFTVTD